MVEEHFRVIPAYPWYAVSDHGRLLNMREDRFIKPIEGKDGYLQFCLADAQGKRTKTVYAHRLIPLIFIGRETNGRVVWFKDADIKNIRLDNFEVTERRTRASMVDLLEPRA